MTYANIPGDARCECHESEWCHENIGEGTQCRLTATCVLFRIDMDDETGTAFCDDCAEDALDSGLFISAEDFDDEVTS
jgi:hypothetical protein